MLNILEISIPSPTEGCCSLTSPLPPEISAWVHTFHLKVWLGSSILAIAYTQWLKSVCIIRLAVLIEKFDKFQMFLILLMFLIVFMAILLDTYDMYREQNSNN